MKVVKDRTKTKKEKATHLGKESGPKLRNAFGEGGRGGGGVQIRVWWFLFLFFSLCYAHEVLYLGSISPAYAGNMFTSYIICHIMDVFVSRVIHIKGSHSLSLSLKKGG